MTDTTPRLSLPLLVPGQAQKEVTVNDALATIDALLVPRVEGVVDAPPAAAEPGQSWCVGGAPSGGFAGQAGALALRIAGGWRFAQLPVGTTLPAADGLRWTRGSSGWQRPPLYTAPPAPAAGEVQDIGARGALSILAQAMAGAGLIRLD